VPLEDERIIIGFGHEGDKSYHQKDCPKNSGTHGKILVAFRLVEDLK